MKLLRLTKQNVLKSFVSLGFISCVLITFGICFSSEIALENNETSITVFNIIMGKNDVLFDDFHYAFEAVLMNGSGSWLMMFLPIIVSLVYVPLFCDERESRMTRYVIGKVGKLSYNWGNFIANFLVSGLAVMLGYALFMITCGFFFPPISAYPEDQQAIFKNMLENDLIYRNLGLVAWEISQFLCIFVYSAMWSLPAFGMSAVIRNKYLLTCIPFFVKYILDQGTQKLMFDAMQDWMNIDVKKFDFIQIISTNSLRSIFNSGHVMWKIAVLQGAILIVFLVSHNLLMNRRFDLGD
ncbi:hypothetical protein FACS1894217_12830 [Clostridia bacterium]|nr:hypothetical protein FACS1894217_12830 [Clostridia bacterium]